MDDHSTTYTTASGVWRRGGVIKIFSKLDTLIANFPLDFVKHSGDNTWRYILLVVNMIVEVDAIHPGHIEDRDGRSVGLELAPEAGAYYYMELGKVSGHIRLSKC
jgi:hypothetical protein